MPSKANMAMNRFLSKAACLLLFSGLPHAFAEEINASGPPMMLRPVSEVLAEQQELMSMPVVRADPHRKLANTSKNLLSYLNCDPAERSQLYCGNCWQWACTAEIEIMLNVRYGIFNRLSVQLISSCYSSSGCCNIGGAGGHFADFYNIRKYFLPWSNHNANWQNGGGSCSVACGNIDTSFKYPIKSIQNNRIETQGVSQDTAIQNIKSVLDQNRAVCFWFAIPNNGGIDFTNFWHSMPESTRWDPSRHAGTILSNGFVFAHGVACVGYDDTNPTDRYWLMLNSWGTPDQRYNGLFRVRMDVDYNACSVVTNLNAPDQYMYQFQWSCLDVAFDDQAHWDDLYDQSAANNTRTTATDFNYHWSRTWLSSIRGAARQYNDDWYKIELLPPNVRIDAKCVFTNAAGDIDLDLVNASGAVVASAHTTNNTETISQLVGTPGTYYLHVFGKANPGTAGRNTGNTYDLWWRDTMDDDVYEDNDTLSTATDISKNKWLSETPDGVARQYDVDWYRIPVSTVATDAPRLSVTCQFNHAEGDIDIAVYSATARLAESTTAQSTETIHATLEKGTYYLAVYGHGAAGNKGNAYDLWWNPQVDDDRYETGLIRPYPTDGSDGWAYDPGYNWRGVWLSTIDGRGRVMDDDWYKIEVKDFTQPVVVTCRFIHAECDLQLTVDNLDDSFVRTSSGSDDGEALSFNAPSNGVYYICVKPAVIMNGNILYSIAPTGSRYDLRWTNGDAGFVDDAYETNNTLGTAFDLSTNEAAWLSAVAGVGYQRDQDWFRISAGTDHLRIVATCRFTHAEGNIDLALYNTGGRIVDSIGVTNEEVIDYTVATTGTYYLAVLAGSGGNRTNAYDLWWAALDSTGIPRDDAYEENDALEAAYDLRARPGEWLSTLAGPGKQADLDWYKIQTDTDGERIVATCSFTHAEGNIDLALYNALGPLADSLGSGNEETLDYTAATAGTYYLVVLGNNGGDKTNAYDLWWANVRPPVVSTDDAYEENDTFAEANAPGDTWKGHWLSTVNGAGILADDDWYQIAVPDGSAHVVITCSFANAQGNIDIALYSAGGRIADSMGTGDEEVIDCDVPGPGTYAIAVDGVYATNAYDLWWDAPGTSDDAFEINNSLDTAYYPGSDWSGQWLSVIGGGGGGIQRDEDWYRVDVAPGQLRLVVTCSFTHAEGDIDLDLCDADNNLLLRSAGTADGESISYLVPSPGAYYVKVYGYFQGGNLGSAYDLQYQTEVTDDAYEENDTQMSAYNLGAAGGIWLSSLSGLGIQGDEDWYQFSVQPGHLQIAATCTFTHAEGNIDLALWSTNGLLASSAGTTDAEAINFNVSTSGVYYLRIWGDNLNNAYDLWWSALQPLTPAVPVIVQFQVSRSNLEKRVVVQTEQGRIYLLQGTTNPLGSATWIEQDASVAVGSETDLRDTNQNHTAYFYRIQAQPVSQPQLLPTEQVLLDSTPDIDAGTPVEILTDPAPAAGTVVVTVTWEAIDLVEGGAPITIPLRIILNDGLLGDPAATSPWSTDVGGIAASESVKIQIYDDVPDTSASAHILAVWHAD